MKNNKAIILIAVISIFILGLALRLYRLDQNIPPLYADEAGGHYIYRAQMLDPSLSKFQKIVRFVQVAPLSYSWLLGMTPLGARLSSAINGSLVCIGVFLFVQSVCGRLNSKRKYFVPVLACLLASLLPWSFMVSRIFPHVPLMLFFICAHLSLFIGSKSIKSDLLSLIPLLVGTIFYLSMVIMAPVAVILVLIDIYTKLSSKQKKKFIGLSFALGIILLAIFTLKFNLFDSKGRGLDLAIWRDVNVTADANLYRGIARQSQPTIFSFGQSPETISNKIFFNYPNSIFNVFIKNYLSFFSPDFLFLKGDNVLRHSTGMVGEFFPFLLPFMVYGAYVFFKNSDKKLRIIFLLWIIFSPIPAAITKDGATYLLRVYTLMPFLTYFCAQGIVSSFQIINNRSFNLLYGAVIILIGVLSSLYFYFGYYHVYPTLSAPQWEYGFKEVSDFQVLNPGKMLVIWDDKYPVWYFCFWQKLPVNVCDLQKINNSEKINGTRIDFPVNNLLFSLPQNTQDFDAIIQKYKPVYIVLSQKFSTLLPGLGNEAVLVEVIKYPDKTVAFSIYKVNY